MSSQNCKDLAHIQTGLEKVLPGTRSGIRIYLGYTNDDQSQVLITHKWRANGLT
jgi:hypothetical protein